MTFRVSFLLIRAFFPCSFLLRFLFNFGILRLCRKPFFWRKNCHNRLRYGVALHWLLIQRKETMYCQQTGISGLLNYHPDWSKIQEYPYSSKYSEWTHTQHQLLILLLLKEYLAEDYRDTVELTEIMDSLHEKIQLDELPHFHDDLEDL